MVVVNLWVTAKIQDRVAEFESRTKQNFGFVTEWSYQVDQHLLIYKDKLDTLAQELDLFVLESCGVIANEYSHGSCVAIGPNLILTAGHCIGIPDAWIEIGGIKYKIIEEWASDTYDIGLVRIEGDVPFVILGEMPALLQKVYKIGFPVQREFENFIAVGVVANLDIDFYVWHNIIILDSPGIGGQSGCGIFDIDGKLVAIHVGHISYGFGIEEPVSHIREVLEEYLAR